MNNSLVSKSLSLLVLPLLIGCGGSSGPTSSSVSDIDNSSVTKKMGGGSKILSNGQGMSIIPKQATGDGDYYLAPSVQFAKIGMGNHVTEMTYIDENGDNHYGLDNILKTQLKVMPLDIHYNSSNARDNYVDMGHWRTSFTSRMDFPINEGDIKDKSNFYDSPRDACESGFGDIKESAYRGILKDATSVYDKDHDMCVLKQDGKDIGKFIVWNRSQKRDDVHYIETATQEFLTFVKNDEGKFVSEQSGVALALTKEADGAYSYKDAQDILRRYNSDGKLVYMMKEGQEAHLTYDESGKLDKVTGALDNVIDFNYDDKNLLSEIIGNSGTIKLSLAYNDKSLLSKYKMNFIDGNNSRTLIETNYAYDSNNILSMIESPARTTPEGEEILSSIVYYKYDNENRISAVESDGSVQRIKYEASKVTKSLPNNTTAIANLMFIDGKQAIKDSTDSHVTTDFSFNKEGLLSDVALSEKVKVEDNSSSNIQSNAFTSKKITLNLQMDYNKKGLIKSQYLETSDGKKSFKNFEYKTKYNKPTKILTEDDVTFFDFNNKGQLIKKSYLKYSKDMKIKPHALSEIKQEAGYQEKSYSYDANGLLTTHKNEITGEENKFYADRTGKIHKGNIQANWFGWGSWWWWGAWTVNNSTRGEISGIGTFDMQDPDNTQTVFVGGAGEGWKHWNVTNYSYNANRLERPANSTFYKWWQVDPWYGINAKDDRFKKEDGKLLMVIGHSYGGDSSVEASKETASDKQVDLLITVDPVGAGDWNDGSRYWIELYADPGRWYGYVRVKWVRKWWGGYPKFYWEPSQWNTSDWVAWSGGKGWYSTYDQGDAYPDVFWKTKAHHEQFGYMLEEFQNSDTKYNFRISDGNEDRWKLADEYK